jgi:threonine dehydrogenase-like Zn-dependent dehydrogenase
MGTAFMKDITFRIGLVNVPAFIPTLTALIRSGRIEPRQLITHRMPLAEGREAYDIFDKRRDGCLKVVLTP